MLRSCCCHYAPTIIVLDLVMILILIGEMFLIFPNRKVSLLEQSHETDEYGLKKS